MILDRYYLQIRKFLLKLVDMQIKATGTDFVNDNISHLRAQSVLII